MIKLPCVKDNCTAPVACEAFGYCRERRINEYTPLERKLANALFGMFALHEPEGRFQPSYYKPVLAEARVALSAFSGKPEELITRELAALWQATEREFLKAQRS